LKTRISITKHHDKLNAVKLVGKYAQYVYLRKDKMSEEKKALTAKEFLNDPQSAQFKSYCDKAGVAATKRQVRKFKLHRGAAYKAMKAN
jgi:hypothetical protein